MLLNLMYHRVGEGKHANTLETLKRHFSLIKERYPVVLPGDPLPEKRLAVCITFDDATFDFYHHVFPLLKTFGLRALLGVPVRYILESTDLTAEERLSVPYTLAMQDGFFDQKAPFCTWKEVREMVQSGLVEVASHSYMHCNLTFPFVDLEREVVASKHILEENTQQAVSSFIYPFGKVTPQLHHFVAGHYPYAFRIGSAACGGWGKGKRPLARVSADNIAHPEALFTLGKRLRYQWNRVV